MDNCQWKEKPDGSYVNQIDYVLTEKDEEMGVTNIRSFKGQEADTDHFWVRNQKNKVSNSSRISRLQREEKSNCMKDTDDIEDLWR